MTEMVTGGRTSDAQRVDRPDGRRRSAALHADPLAGSALPDELEAEVESAMESLGDPDDAFRYHHSYVLAVARKR